MNNNGARNVALSHGKKRAKWVLPWDGNCFMTMQAWQELTATIQAQPHLKYFAVAMARVKDNAVLLDNGFLPGPGEGPQLGIPGKWDGWK